VSSSTTRTIKASDTDLWDILSNGWLYGTWVVGASRIRDIEGDWPGEGSRIHHSVGMWPLALDDTTQVTSCTPCRELKLQARAWPGGEATVRLLLEPHGESECVVTMIEDASDGPARLIPPPVRHALLGWRNKESLQRLAYLAEGSRKQRDSHRD
jgi:hypothetical protein